MNYKIINDEAALTSFIDWLPELKPNEIFYGCLFARKKYCPDLVHSSDKTQLKRFTFRKDNFHEKIKQLECEVGSYSLKGRPVPQEALVLYCTPNPRDQRRATFASIRELLALVESDAVNFNLHQEVMSNIQRSKGTTHFVDFDFDLADKSTMMEFVGKINEVLPTEATSIIETRGGIHCLVHPPVATKHDKKWYPELRELGQLDQVGDQLIPVVGCTQGGFTPKFIIRNRSTNL